MPELPEVESLRRSLEPSLLGRTVHAAVVHRRDVLIAPGDPFGGFARQRSPHRTAITPRRIARADLLVGSTITALGRRGKQLALIARDPSGRERAIVVQLGMSGQLIYLARGARPRAANHVHATWRIGDGRLIFRDPRRFGGLRLFPTLEALHAHWASLGPDALTLTRAELAHALTGSGRAVKAALLDQGAVAGVGNIYADESLFIARILPSRLCSSLKPRELGGIASAIPTVLERSIASGGSTLRDYVDSRGRPGSYQLAHAVYGRAGQPCLQCARTLSGGILAQRATVWCAHCQH